jgi:hypothetical protein
MFSRLGRTLLAGVSFAPNGASTCQPRATPWVAKCTVQHALKGRDKDLYADSVSPFQGFDREGASKPRALPWADMCGPFRPKRQNGQLQMAEALIHYRGDDALRDRIALLAEECTEGEMTLDEQAEYEGYIRSCGQHLGNEAGKSPCATRCFILEGGTTTSCLAGLFFSLDSRGMVAGLE